MLILFRWRKGPIPALKDLEIERDRYASYFSALIVTHPDLVSSWTLLRRRKRLRSSISSCRRVSPSRSCDASQCGKGIPSSVLLFSVFPPGCPRLDEQWANLRLKDLWLIQLSVISCTIYTVCMATHCEILSYWHKPAFVSVSIMNIKLWRHS